MKHIFTIHSHITLISSLCVIEYEKLRKKDVIFVCTRYVPDIMDNSGITVVESFDDEERENSLFKKLFSVNYGQGCDNFIDRLTTGESYCAYLDVMSVFNRFLATHPKCRNFSFIEEGTANYADFESFDSLTIDLDQFSWRLKFPKSLSEILKSLNRILRGRSLRILNLPVQPNVYAFFSGVTYYGLSEWSYPNIPETKRKVLPINLCLKEFKPFDDKGFDFDDSILWIGDGLVRRYSIPMKEFEDSLDDLIRSLNLEKVRKVFIKYKRYQNLEERKVTEKVFSNNGFEITVLDFDVVIERILLLYKNVTCLGIISSLLVYAKFLGADVHSIFHELREKNDLSFYDNYSGVLKLINDRG